MQGFSVSTTAKALRQDICKVAYRMALAKMVENGDITADQAYDKQQEAMFNIDAYGLTISDEPLFWSVFGMDKREFNRNLNISK
jgi:hypothetical protein